MRPPLGGSVLEDQHVLGEPSLVVGHRRRDAQRVALLAQQRVTASPPLLHGARERASAKPRRPGWPTCPATPFTLMLPGSKSSWPQPIWSPGPNSSDSSATSRSPAARSPLSATGCYTPPPASPVAPAKPGYASTPPGGGPQRSRPPGNASAPPSPDRRPTSPTDHESTALGSPAQPGDTGRSSTSLSSKSRPHRPIRSCAATTPTRMQNRG